MWPTLFLPGLEEHTKISDNLILSESDSQLTSPLKALRLPKNSTFLWQKFDKIISNSESIDRNAGLISENGVEVANNAADISANEGRIQNVELTGSIWFEAIRLVKLYLYLINKGLYH